jgi:hypothetical protein
MRRRVLALVWALALWAPSALGQAKRLVIVKVDGLPGDVVEKYAGETDPTTGKSRLPWIHRVFIEQGAWVKNFYVRGISLSVPSWQLLDTGHSALIRGNAEYDRFTGRVYDYMNFFPFYLGYSKSKLVDMPGVEVLDQCGAPLLIDRFGWEQRYQTLELFQRAVRWRTLQGVLTGRFQSRSPRELFDEWQTGFEMRQQLVEQLERDVMASLANPGVLFLDYQFPGYDHLAHLTNDEASQYDVAQQIDGIVGRLWTAAENSPLGRDTLFVLVSDHGTNSDPKVYSQGFNLLRFFGLPEGGAHHVLMNRHPMMDYKLRGLDPFVSTVVTPSEQSRYLRGEAEQYPTAALDLDGNERGAVYLRNSKLNIIHVLLEQLNRTDLADNYRRAVVSELGSVLDARRRRWEETSRELREELAALHRAIERRRADVDALPKKWSKEERESGKEQQARRMRRELDIWQEDEQSYSEYCSSLEKLARLRPEQLEPGKIPVRGIIPKRAFGERNSIADLQRYVTGLSARGLVLTSDGSLDTNASFERINYFARLASLRVRNNVQAQVGPKPVDFIAVSVPKNALAALAPSDQPDEDAVWLYGDDQRQALVLSKHDPSRGVLLRYMPVRGLQQDENGTVRFEPAGIAAGFPLHLFEDPAFNPPGGRAAWLSQWHTEDEWLRSTHRTKYSNAVIGLHAHFAPVEIGADGALWRGAGADAALLRRFAARKRNLVEADLLVLANDHWNFNVRNFNPGGNHGSFFRVSTHSVWMMAGAGVPRGVSVETPCDSLSFVPTLLKLMGAAAGDLAAYPGRPIELNVAADEHR